MFIYGKTTANGIAVMSYLAMTRERLAGSAEIAEARELSRALTAKLLTQLAAAGLVTGQPGPGGGYRLAVPSEEISLLDIAEVFEDTSEIPLCPFGKTWCGRGEECPLHDTLSGMQENHRQFLVETRLSVFAGEHPVAVVGPSA